jgi:hypothetical protein
MSVFLSIIRNLSGVIVVTLASPFGYNIFTIQFQCHKSYCPGPLDETPTTKTTTMTMKTTTPQEPGADVADPAPRATLPAPPDSCLQQRTRLAKPILDGSVRRSRDIPSLIRQTWRGGGSKKRTKLQRMDLHDVVSFSNVMTTMASPSFFCSLHSATLQFFGQRNNVKVEKAQLLMSSKNIKKYPPTMRVSPKCPKSAGAYEATYPFVPGFGRVGCGATVEVSLHHFFKQALVPLRNVPKAMLMVVDDGGVSDLEVVMCNTIHVPFDRYASVALQMIQRR